MRIATPVALMLAAVLGSCAARSAAPTEPVAMASVQDLPLCPGLWVTEAEALPPHQAAARRLLAEVTPEQTSYRHRPATVQFKTESAPAECRTDCSGLLTALFQSTYHITDEGVVKWLHTKRPLASTYHDAIVESNCVQRIELLKDAFAGDIVAVKFPESAKDTGHTMLIDAPPAAREATPPLIEGTHQYEVAVIDVTSSPHGDSDSRLVEGIAHPGLGRGVIRVYVDDSGAIAGYTWSTAKNSVFRPQFERHMVIGRLPVP